MVCLVMDDCFTHSGFILQSFVLILESFWFYLVHFCLHMFLMSEEEQEIIIF